MTDTFFDLQRFAADVVLGGTSTGFEWDNGQFVGGGDSTANVGSATNPAYWAATGGVSAVAGSEVYLTGKDGYSFSIQNKEWSLALADEDILKASKDGNHAFAGTNSTLDVDGTFEENVNGIDQYVSGDINATVGNSGTGTGLLYTFEKDANDVDVALPEGTAAIFGKNSTDITLGVAKDSLSISGLGFKEGITAANTNGEISFVTGNNTITLPAGVLDLKTSDAQVALLTTASIAGAKSATLTTSTGISGVTFNETTWNEISGVLNTIKFDSVGSATVDNSGFVVADGEDGAQLTIKNLDSAIVNDVAVKAEETAEVSFTLETVEGGGISAIGMKKDTELTVAGDNLFDVNVGTKTYAVATDADKINFEAVANALEVDVEADKGYAVTGGNALFEGVDGANKASLNGAAVSVSSGTLFATAIDGEAGISAVVLAADAKVSVTGDADGFTANYLPVSDDSEHVFQVNNASITAADIADTMGVAISVGADSNSVTVVTGMADTEKVSVSGGTTGMTYHFKDDTKENQVKVGAGETVYVTLDSAGNVADSIDEENYMKKVNDDNKWNDVSSIGSAEDSVVANHADAYEQFYNLDVSEAGQVSVASFANEDSTEFDTVSNSTGVEIVGSDVLAQANHVTLTAGSAVGLTELNIQADESSNVYDVTIDLRTASGAPNVAIGTLGSVSASHEVYLSNAAKSTAYIGALATGQNKIFAGTAGSQIRHDGVRATITGNSGNDTIWAGRNDIVTGGAGADYFYDSANYTVSDYDASQGDLLIATRVNSVADIDKGILNYGDAGNEIGFGSSNKEFTIGTNQNASLNMKVAVMDTNADVVGYRNVAVAGINGGALDASTLDGAALIVADYDRNGISGDNVIGTAGSDTIYVGLNDTVNAGEGNDAISIGGPSTGGAGVTVQLSAGRDTISGWTFGFDKNAGATELIAGEGYQAEFENDRLKVTDSNGEILIDDTTHDDNNHGQYNILINDTKWMAIRTNDGNKGYTSYGLVASNEDIADNYIAEREGNLIFGSGVTQDLGVINLSRYNDPTNYQDITHLVLANNSKASVFGTSERETIVVSGDADAGANKKVSLGAGNDVIVSSGDSSLTAGHMFYFGANDGLDTIRGFGHYLGVEQDPDKQYADTLVVEKYNGITTGTGENGGARIDFFTEGDNRISIYENEGINVNNVYQIKLGEFDTKLAKIGYSNGSNEFTYSDKVDYYVGSSAENAQDTLNVGNEIANANIWLDGTNGTYDTNADEQYYRGIAVVNASAETNTNVAIAGNGNNNTLYGGGAGTNNSLWGGAGDNVLIGSEEGNDVFFYVRNAGAYLQGVDDTVTGGNDTVYNYDLDNDIVWLGDTTLDDIASTEVTDNSVVVNFKNGGSLTVDGLDDVRFAINSGTEIYVTNKDSESDNKWTKEA
ncbi:MAG: hypothetical protein IKE46_06040 [Selenomonadaceae bacterium]|nr:hypothetical protein [Selenomonadaceae bacterium]